MQYFGYLRRNPNDPQDTDYTGFDFWLTKLNQQEGRLLAGGMELAEKLPDPKTASSTYDQQLDEKRLAEVSAAIEDLPSQQRRCLLLRVQHELSYEEIADTLRLSVNTVRNHLAEARKNLRQRFDPDSRENEEL